MKKPFKRQRIGAGKAPVLLLVLLLCGFFLEARGDGLIPMFPDGTAGLIRGGIRFDMLPEEVEAVENANGLAPFQVARAFTLSWERIEYTGMEEGSLHYRFEKSGGLRLQEILWTMDTGEDGQDLFDANAAALTEMFGEPYRRLLPCPTDGLAAMQERLLVREGAQVYTFCEWLWKAEEGDVVMDLYFCRNVRGQEQLRLGLMLLSDPEAARNRAFAEPQQRP